MTAVEEEAEEVVVASEAAVEEAVVVAEIAGAEIAVATTPTNMTTVAILVETLAQSLSDSLISSTLRTGTKPSRCVDSLTLLV